MRFLIISAVWLFSSIAAAQEGLVMHWDDGSTMKCRFIFEPEEVYELDPTNLPVTVSDVHEIIRDWAVSQDGSSNPLILNYRLIFVHPAGHSNGIWTWFMDYIPASSDTPRPRPTSNAISLAITMKSQLIVGDC